MIDRFFDGDIDQQVFEEHTRYIFTTDAYLIFTMDKLVHSMVKQVGKTINYYFNDALTLILSDSSYYCRSKIS
jgi:histone deacetylase complex regulatory component SIN3